MRSRNSRLQVLGVRLQESIAASLDRSISTGQEFFLKSEAERLGLFAWELSLQLTAASAEDFQAQRLEVHKEVAEMAGMDWAEYCQLHGLDFVR